MEQQMETLHKNFFFQNSSLLPIFIQPLTLYFKIHFNNFRLFLKKLQNLYDFLHFLNLNLEFRLS